MLEFHGGPLDCVVSCHEGFLLQFLHMKENRLAELGLTLFRLAKATGRPAKGQFLADLGHCIAPESFGALRMPRAK